MATTTQGRIYSQFMEACPAFQPPHGWDFLPGDPALRSCPPDSAHVVSRLVEEFGTRSMQQAGVIVGPAEEAPAINPALAVEGGTLLMLRDAAGVPLDIITPGGCLSGGATLLQVWRDGYTRRVVRPPRSRLFGVTSMGDVALLRCLGFGAAPIVHLNRLTLTGLRRLAVFVGEYPFGAIAGEPHLSVPAEYFEGLNQSSLRGDEAQRLMRFNLTLITQPLGSRTPIIAERFVRVARHLADAARHLGLDWLHVDVWWPTADDLARLDYLRRLQSTNLIRQLVCAPRHTHTVEEFVDPSSPPSRPGPVDDFAAARDQLLRLLGDHRLSGYGEDRVRQARQQYEQLLERDLVTPLVRQGLTLASPAARSRAVALAEVGRLAHEQAMVVHEELSAATHRARPGAEGSSPSDALQQYLALIDRMVALGKQVT